MSRKAYKFVKHPAVMTVSAALIIGLAFGMYLYFSYDRHWQRIITSILSALTIGCLMMICIYQRRYILLITVHQSLKMLLLIICLCIAALLGTEVTLWIQALIMPDVQFAFFTGGDTYVLNILIALVTGIPIYVSEEAKDSLNSRLMKQQYLLLQLEKQQMEAELELLRAKINPHFLYNVHNTIAGLITSAPAKAEQMLLLLSKFFRFSLNKTSTGLHTVMDELDIVNTYLELQQIRYESRLSFVIDIAQGAEYELIPSFILQPLVENAVKYGIEPLAAEGYIKIDIEKSDKTIFLTVADSGPDFPETPGSGHGLTIIMNKLKLLYGNNYSLELINEPCKYVRISLPQTS